MELTFAVLSDPGAFLERAGRLAEDEPRNGLVRGIALGLSALPERIGDSRFFVIESNGEPVAAAMITPPFKLLLLDAVDSDAIDRLARVVHDSVPTIPGVMGNRPSVHTFKDAWVALTGTDARLEMEQGILSLETVQEVSVGTGCARRATMGDVDLVVGWMRDFAAEALPGGAEDVDRLAGITRRRLVGTSSDGFWLWEVDGAPVAMSGQSGPTGTAIRINSVYTPPAMRSNGYATSLVAHHSRWLLDSGYRRCFLYSDLANVTSNAIYRRIGYQQVAESAMYRFARPSAIGC